MGNRLPLPVRLDETAHRHKLRLEEQDRPGEVGVELAGTYARSLGRRR